MESRKRSQNHDEDRGLKERLDKLAQDIEDLPPDRIEKVEGLVKSMTRGAVGLRQAASLLGVSVQTLRRAIKSGALRAFQINRAGNWSVPMEEIERFIRGEKK